MKLKQAIDITANGHYLYPKCVQSIEDKIKHLKRQARDGAKASKVMTKTYKADEWEGILRMDSINKNRSARDSKELS